jgi:hypothetical protein
MFQQIGKYLAVATSALVLVACGGSDGGGEPSVPPTSQSALSALQGTWLGTCDVTTDGANQPVGASRETLVIGAVAANGSVTATSTERFYTTADCTGTSVATITELPATLISSGTKTISGLSALKIDATFPAGTPTFSGPNVNLVAPCSVASMSMSNCLVISLGTGSASTSIIDTIPATASNVKLVLLLNSAGTQFDIGDNSDNDAQGYPNTVLPPSEGRYIKQ